MRRLSANRFASAADLADDRIGDEEDARVWQRGCLVGYYDYMGNIILILFLGLRV